MAPMAGWVTIVVSGTALLAVALVLRPRLHPALVTATVAVSAAVVGVGGLLVLHDVGTASWIVAPLVLAVAAVGHVRFLFAGQGPFRT